MCYPLLIGKSNYYHMKQLQKLIISNDNNSINRTVDTFSALSYFSVNLKSSTITPCSINVKLYSLMYAGNYICFKRQTHEQGKKLIYTLTIYNNNKLL